MGWDENDGADSIRACNETGDKDLILLTRHCSPEITRAYNDCKKGGNWRALIGTHRHTAIYSHDTATNNDSTSRIYLSTSEIH